MATDVRLASPDDLRAMGQSLGLAFADDPVMVHLFGGDDDGERSRRMAPWFSATAKVRLKLGGVWTATDRSGAAVWVPPGQRVTIRQDLPTGVAFARAAWRRLGRGLRALQVLEDAHPHDPPHWYLSILGTRPEHQGRGVGAALLAPVLARCDAEGVPAYLESSKESNVSYYEGFGFRVTGELSLSPAGPKLWPMWRDPA